MRIWQELGIADELLADALPVERYEWFGADGEPIVAFDMPPAPSGWAFSYTFFQPELEAALERLVEGLPTVLIRRGVACTRTGRARRSRRGGVAAVRPRGEQTEQRRADRRRVRARYLVGARRCPVDRARPARHPVGRRRVRRALVRDRRPAARSASRRTPPDFPMQFCEPARPHMMAPNGRRHRRWEFMLIENEDAADYERPEHVWSLLEPWLAPDDATVIRGAVYEFRAAVAESFQSGRRCFLVGDAAHRMPPHLGEGMCSGLRDAKALGLAARVGAARSGRRRRARVVHVRAPARTRARSSSSRWPWARCPANETRPPRPQRDRALRAAGGVEPWPFPGLGPGLGHPDERVSPPLVGQLSVQGRVESGGREGLLDDVIGRGFVLLVDGSVPAPDPRGVRGDRRTRSRGWVTTSATSTAG